MIFKGSIEEFLFLAELVPERMYMFDEDLETGLSIVWNIGEKASFTVDNEVYKLEKNTIFFLTGLHKITDYQFDKLNVIQFNRPFYCVENHDDQVGCRGLLFFGASTIPNIQIPKEKLKSFKLLWEILMQEVEEEEDELKIDMLRVLLKRFLILCVRIYKKQKNIGLKDSTSIGIIREYNYLVEKHFKTYTTVTDYARLLFKSPKTLSNLFKRHIDKTPLQIITERRLLEAKRMLKNTTLSVQEISDELSFNDIQAFSNFFKKHTSLTPSAYKVT